MGNGAAFRYLTRITPALALGALTVLLYLSLTTRPSSSSSSSSSSSNKHSSASDPSQQRHRQHGHATLWQWLLCIYVLFLHNASLMFTVRAFRSLGYITGKIRETAAATTALSVKPSSDVQRLVRFAIIIPTYKEERETLRRTLEVLASHPQARFLYHVYLGMEQREEGAEAKAKDLMLEYRHKFFYISFTVHPAGLPNEAPGKSSNESWVGRQILKDYPLDKEGPEVIVTTMDSDTYLSPRYFAQITHSHLAATPSDRLRTIYVPPLVFDRNLHQTPLSVRLADIIWANAGISNMNSPHPTIAIPTSVYSLPLELLSFVGGWDADATAIGEDMHMFLKCFFHLGGNLRSEVVFAAASQCDVSGPLTTGIRGYAGCLWARYEQACRHMWGALDTGFAVRGAVEMVGRRWALARKSRSEGEWRDEKGSTALSMSEKFTCTSTTTTARTFSTRINTPAVLTVFARLFDAHFIPAQLPLVLAASSLYTTLTPPFLTPQILSWTLTLCSYSRVASFLIMLGALYRYEEYHQLNLGLRKEEMRSAGLLEEMAESDTFSENVFATRLGVLETLVFPFGGVVYGTVPALMATVWHCWTEALVYRVSLKPLLRAAREVTAGCLPVVEEEEEEEEEEDEDEDGVLVEAHSAKSGRSSCETNRTDSSDSSGLV